MQPKEYLTAMLSKVDEDGFTTCVDCNKKSRVAHAIVDHDEDTVKTVCNDCFNAKYRQELYGGTV